MRSGWPHTQDDRGRPPADQRQAPFGPDISWPTGYSELEYRDGDYRYPAPYSPQPPGNHGEHPYAAFSGNGYGEDPGGRGGPAAHDFGYGDPGYSDLGYNGPASQDAGIAGTRTVRGFVEASQAQPRYALPSAPQSGYAQPGYAPAGPAPAGPGYGQPGYGPGYDQSGHIELAYPSYEAAETYRQPWDYDQPLRYEGEEETYPVQGSYGPAAGHDELDGYGSGSHRAAPYTPAEYNGSDYSMPGIDGPGYDLSGIIGTGDFEAFSYDEPSYDRLSYDDPRYDDRPGYGGQPYDSPAADDRHDGRPGPRFDETRFDVPRFDETRLDSLWLAREDVRHDEPAGYRSDWFGTDGQDRSGYSDYGTNGGADLASQLPAAGPRDRRFTDTRLDLRADDLRMDLTRFDTPVLDETRMENMRALRSSTGLLAPPEDQPLNWPEADSFGDLDLDDQPGPVPAAFGRTAERRGDADDDTATRRAIGRRRGRSGDRRQWMALGAIAVVAAGAIGGVLMKYVFSGPSGPAHTVVAPTQADGFTRMPNLEKEMKVDALRDEVMKSSAGQASNVVSAVYQQGSTAPGGNAQIFMFVGGNLSSAAPTTSIANFTQEYPGAKVVPAGSLGGEAACAEAQSNGQGVAMCVWFDNDSFGELVSPTMTTAKLATTLDSVRPSLELYTR